METQAAQNPAETRRDIRTQLGEIERLGYQLCLVLLAILAGLALADVANRFGAGSWAFVLALGATVSFASATAGAVLGFLFGVPRLLNRYVAKDKPDQANATDNPLQRGYLLSNSNLESISDWLTSILVGLGLIHLTKVPQYIGDYRNWLQTGLSGLDKNEAAGDATALVMLTIAMLTGSFLFFYVQTRTRLTLLLSDTEEARLEGYTNTVIAEAAQFDRGSLAFAAVEKSASIHLSRKSPRSAKALVLDAEVLRRRSPANDDDAAYWAAWAAANARSGHYAESEAAWAVAVGKAPQDVNYRAQYGDVLQASGEFKRALEQFDKAIEMDGPKKRYLVGKLVAALYEEDPDLVDIAIKTADQLYANPNVRKDPWIKLWRVCAYAQKFMLLDDGDPQRQTIREVVRDGLVELTKKVPDLQSNLRVFLRQLLEPSYQDGDPTEDDLSVFSDDQEIVRIIRGTP